MTLTIHHYSYAKASSFLLTGKLGITHDSILAVTTICCFQHGIAQWPIKSSPQHPIGNGIIQIHCKHTEYTQEWKQTCMAYSDKVFPLCSTDN
jgi:hypothetical protein